MAKRIRRTVTTADNQPHWVFRCRAEYLGHTIAVEELYRPIAGLDRTINKPVRVILDGAVYAGFIGGSDVTSPGCAINHVKCELYQRHLAKEKTFALSA